MLKTLKIYFQNLAEIAFPNNCLACRKSLLQHEETICENCLDALPETHYCKTPNNASAQLFWGRVEVEHAASLFYVNKHNRVHDLIHLLKYANKTEIGIRLGKIAGERIRQKDSLLQGFDCIVPVPLHPKKEKLRGYNQSSFFAQGISAITRIAVDEKTLIRTKENISQTRKNKYERWENVDNIFQLTNAAAFINKHVLLVDDVLTTGATTEACVHALKQSENVRVSILTIGTAERQ